MELISVIVPVYNVEKWVGEALESLRSQTYGHFEAILVNDGSTDGSEAICRAVCKADPRFRLVSQPNQGLPGARNTGLAHATG
ncbi:MAG: glycosyltransferase, partial [Muribaculaceae bacterium]|nr:glycosyltransferase [Muribaculaceae bacterium]